MERGRDVRDRYQVGGCVGLHRLAASAVALAALGGCAGATTEINPSQLPALAESAARDPSGPYASLTVDRRPVTVKGPLSSVVVKVDPPKGAAARGGGAQSSSRGRSGSEDTFTAPFQASLDGSSLRVADRSHEQVYAYSELESVVVHHARPSVRREVGIGLVVASIVPFGFAAMGFKNAADWADVNEPPGPGPGFAVGFLGLAGGLGLAITGTVLIATHPDESPKSERPAASLHVGPTGANLKLTF
jgi:hypothetical protein